MDINADEERQRMIRKLFHLREGVWELCNTGGVIDVWRTDKKGEYFRFEEKEEMAEGTISGVHG